MAENYLYEKIVKKSFPAHIEKAVQDCLIEVRGVFADDMLRGSKQVNRLKQDVDDYVSQYSEDQPLRHSTKKNSIEEIEENIRLAKLKEAQRMKKELQQKLVTVDENLYEVGQIKQAQNLQKVNLMDQGTRKAFYEQEQEKRKQAEEFSKQVAAKRQAALKKRNEDKHRRRVAELEKQRNDKEIEEEEKATEEMIKKMRLEEMEQKRKERKQELNKQRKLVESGSLPSASRIAQVEHKFKSHILMPELQRRKKEIMQKRELFKPLEHEDLEDHAERYEAHQRKQERLRQKAENERSKSHLQNAHKPEFKTHFQQKRAQEAAIKAQEEAQKLEEKQARLERKNRYSNMVKEIYQPQIDEKKRLEIQLVKDQAHKPVKQPLFRSHSTQQTFDGKSPKIRHKFAPNPMMPPPKTTRINKAVDYLEMRRVMRETESEISLHPRLSSIDMLNDYQATSLTARVDKLEQRALRKELNLENARRDNPKTIEAKDEVADALIGSVRAKLRLLNN